ncbi:amidase family protein [Hydrogenibacillus sp. N12]|uniref:amidase n=1 Tax=Hydrogenibacillus sp. N12 TaxID=2866627 RepID=UPI001C7CF658|nr:amidase family protein [Hydrogenibacillus sp. N12]QZA32318.1 amidase [Hydrogenibacillus sp. N12]
MPLDAADFTRYAELDTVGLAERIRRRELTPEEAVELAFAAIERMNPILGAVVYRREEAFTEGRTFTKRLTGRPHDSGAGDTGNDRPPFYGVPVLVKNMMQEVEGLPDTAGSKAFGGRIATFTSRFARTLQEAGMIIVGATNVPELALLATTEPMAYGPTRNPWDLTRSAGGSSGGSAAAVASGMVPLAGAGDAGGSIRIPAAYNGLFGLKPSRGLVPVGPGRLRMLLGLGTNHVLTRSVRDSAAVLERFRQRGPEPGAAYLPPNFSRPLDTAPDTPLPQPLRVAFWLDSPLGGRPAPEIAAAVRRTAAFFESLGAAVEEAAPPIDGEGLALTYLIAYLTTVAQTTREQRLADFEPKTRLLAQLGRRLPAAALADALDRWDAAAVAMAAFHTQYDLFLTPTTFDVAPPLSDAAEGGPRAERALEVFLDALTRLRLGGALAVTDLPRRIFLRELARTPYTQLANFTGQPAASVPVGLKDGLPVGVQLLAAHGRDDLLLAVAAHLEASELWLRRRPPHHVAGG